MPPEMWHSVYTTGGHCLMYSTMHQTYAAWDDDSLKYPNTDTNSIQLWADYSTNESQSVNRQIL